MTFKRRLQLRARALWRSRLRILVWSLVWAVALSVLALLVFRTITFLKLLGAEIAVFVATLVVGWLQERREERCAKQPPTARVVN